MWPDWVALASEVCSVEVRVAAAALFMRHSGAPFHMRSSFEVLRATRTGRLRLPVQAHRSALWLK